LVKVNFLLFPKQGTGCPKLKLRHQSTTE